jgi:hypothetical protein
MNYQTELRNKNRGYMNLIVWQKADGPSQWSRGVTE